MLAIRARSSLAFRATRGLDRISSQMGGGGGTAGEWGSSIRNNLNTFQTTMTTCKIIPVFGRCFGMCVPIATSMAVGMKTTKAVGVRMPTRNTRLPRLIKGLLSQQRGVQVGSQGLPA